MQAEIVVAWQLGRPPRGTWHPAAYCSFGYPTVIATAPAGAGEPFPTLYYLTCPHLAEAVSRLESAGEIERWRARLAADDALASRLEAADAAYRAERAALAGGRDPARDVGIAGMRDVRATKCLHAHVAARLGGIDDPVGEAVLATLVAECGDGRCREAQ